MDGDSSAQSQSLAGHRSESKILLGQKRGCLEVEDTSENSHKRVKMRFLESVFRSEAQTGIGGQHQDVHSDSIALDLNVGIGSANYMDGNDDPVCFDESNDPPTSEKKEVQCKDGLTKARGFDLDLNAADISSSINDPFYPYKMNEHLRSRDDSDCVSSVGPLEEKDPMTVWKGLKQNNYMSASHGVVPMAIPKARGRKKSSQDVMKKKIELAKKEQVDRFARVAAPSGLLNGLNPGIINHVRNSKQVHSIIEALVRSERDEKLISGSKKHNQIKSGVQELAVRKEGSYGDALQRRMQINDHAWFPKSVYWNTGDGNSYMGHTRILSTVPSQFENANEDNKLPLKLSSSVTVASENVSCLSNGECSVTSLSLKAANVASQWLELLNQDIRGRIAALRRSKKRVRTVITTELPHLISRELLSNVDNSLHTTVVSACHFDQANVDAHSVKWSTLFAQMEKALSEEESHLENWLNQVKEMLSHCEMGLNQHSLSQLMGPLGNDSREKSEKELAVRAAAASIYSTCNMLLSRENEPCC